MAFFTLVDGELVSGLHNKHRMDSYGLDLDNLPWYTMMSQLFQIRSFLGKCAISATFFGS